MSRDRQPDRGRTDRDSGFNVDGELVEERRLEFTVEPRAYEVVAGR